MEGEWNARITTLEAHTYSVGSVAWSHETGEAARIASASLDNTVKV